MFQQLNAIIFVLFLYSAIVSADRGDDLLPLIEAEHLKAHITALQENTRQLPKRIYRTRSAYHRDAADNAAAYIASQFRRLPRLKVETECYVQRKGISQALVFVQYVTQQSIVLFFKNLQSCGLCCGDRALQISIVTRITTSIMQHNPAVY